MGIKTTTLCTHLRYAAVLYAMPIFFCNMPVAVVLTMPPSSLLLKYLQEQHPPMKKKRRELNRKKITQKLHPLNAKSSLHKGYLRSLATLSAFSLILVIANVVGVCVPGRPPGVGVVARLGTALRLWLMWAWTRWPAARAAQRLSSPANTPAAMIRASCLALSPGLVGCGPRTPRRSSMADWGSRIVPPPIVPTSIHGIDTEICRLPLRLEDCK
jgi:hypothetical protein